MRMKVFFLLIISTLFLFITPSVFAQEDGISQLAEIKPSPTVVPEYQLPYPGLLPDNPLYFFKTFRDRIVDILISDPLKKAEFNLLQADKRLSAGQYLFNNGKEELAESTISKGENYFADAIEKTKMAKKQGMDTNYISERLALSAKKHIDILSQIEEKTAGKLKNKIQVNKNRVLEFQKEIEKLQ